MNRFLLALISLCGICGCKKADVPLPMPPEAKLIDVRSREEYTAGHLAGAVWIPHGEISREIAGVAPDLSIPVYLYCRSGRRSGIAKEALTQKGYVNVYNLGGIGDAARILQLPLEK